MEKSIKEEKHPSLEGYIPSEPIPEGYKLDRLFSNNGVHEFAIEFLVPIEKEENVCVDAKNAA